MLGKRNNLDVHANSMPAFPESSRNGGANVQTAQTSSPTEGTRTVQGQLKEVKTKGQKCQSAFRNQKAEGGKFRIQHKTERP